METDKTVVLFVWAPTCENCKKYELIFEKIAIKLTDTVDLLFAKINGAKNEHEYLYLRGFPTVLMFKPSDKENPVVMEDDFDYDNMIDFIYDNFDGKLIFKRDGKSTNDL